MGKPSWQDNPVAVSSQSLTKLWENLLMCLQQLQLSIFIMALIASQPSFPDRDDGRMIYDDMLPEPGLLQSLDACKEPGVREQARPKGAHSTVKYHMCSEREAQPPYL